MPTAVAQLRVALQELQNSQTTAHTPLDRFNAYQRWANGQALTLGLTLTSASLDDLVTCRRYELLQGVDPTRHGAITTLVDLEIQQRTAALSAAVDHLERTAARWSGLGEVVVPDTNLFVHHQRYLEDLDWRAIAGRPPRPVDVVVTTVVLEELDRLKASPGEKKVNRRSTETVRSRARRTLRTIDKAFEDPSWISILVPADGHGHQVHWRLHLDPLDHQPLPVADAELIDRAVEIHDLSGATVTLASFDTTVGLRARQAGLRSHHPIDGDDEAAFDSGLATGQAEFS